MPWAFRNCGWSLNESMCVSVGDREVNGTAAVKIANTAEELARHQASLHERIEGACDFFRVTEEAQSQQLMSGGALAGTVTAAVLVCIIVAVLLYVMLARSTEPESTGNGNTQQRSMGGSDAFSNPIYDAPTARFAANQLSDDDPYHDLASNLAAWDLRDDLAGEENPYGNLGALVSEYNTQKRSVGGSDTFSNPMYDAPTARIAANQLSDDGPCRDLASNLAAWDMRDDLAGDENPYGNLDALVSEYNGPKALWGRPAENVTRKPSNDGLDGDLASRDEEFWAGTETVGDAAAERYPTAVPSTGVSFGKRQLRTGTDGWDGYNEQDQGVHIVGERVQSSGQSIIKLLSHTQANPLFDGHDESHTDDHDFKNVGFGGHLFKRKTTSLTSSQRRQKVLKKRSLQQSDEVTVNNNYNRGAKDDAGLQGIIMTYDL